jgi:hypothetical protein
MFLDAKGQPLADDKVRFIGPDKDTPGKPRRVAVPTHFYKAVLLTLPDGTQSTFAWVMPNRSDVPTKKPNIHDLFEGSVVSVAKVEQLSGLKLFEGLSAGAKKNGAGLAPILRKLVADQTLTADLVAPGGAAGDLGDIWPETLPLPK